MKETRNAATTQSIHIQAHYAAGLRAAVASDPANSLRISRDSAYTENPMDRENMEEIVKARLICGMSDLA